jgi:Helix-turn-helix domain
VAAVSWPVYRQVQESSAAVGITEQAVLLNLADHAATPDGHGAYPSVPTIARETHAGITTVRKTLRQLEARGAIAATGTTPAGVVVYRVVIPQPTPAGAAGSSPRASQTADDLAPRQELPGRGPIGATSDRQEVPPPPAGAAAEPSENGHLSSPRNGHAARARARAGRHPSKDCIERVLRELKAVSIDHAVPFDAVVVREVLDSCSNGNASAYRTVSVVDADLRAGRDEPLDEMVRRALERDPAITPGQDGLAL